jgi:hypothetical protein
MKQLIFIFSSCLILMSCSTLEHKWGDVCEKKECCPMEGHGRCPICFDEDYVNEIKNWKTKNK